MKYIFSLLLIINFVFASQSKYPLDFSFNEDSLFLSHLSLTEDNSNHTVLSIVFYNKNDNTLILSNSIVEVPACNITTLSQMKNILNSNLPKPCRRVFKLYGEKYKELSVNDFTILFYKNSKSNFKAAFIFKKKKFVSTMISNMSNNEFNKLLLSLKENHMGFEKIENYINKYKKYLRKGHLNNSFKQLVNAFILNPNNKKLHNLYHKLIKKRIEKLNLVNNFYHKKGRMKAKNE